MTNCCCAYAGRRRGEAATAHRVQGVDRAGPPIVPLIALCCAALRPADCPRPPGRGPKCVEWTGALIEQSGCKWRVPVCICARVLCAHVCLCAVCVCVRSCRFACVCVPCVCAVCVCVCACVCAVCVCAVCVCVCRVCVCVRVCVLACLRMMCQHDRRMSRVCSQAPFVHKP